MVLVEQIFMHLVFLLELCISEAAEEPILWVKSHLNTSKIIKHT